MTGALDGGGTRPRAGGADAGAPSGAPGLPRDPGTPTLSTHDLNWSELGDAVWLAAIRTHHAPPVLWPPEPPAGHTWPSSADPAGSDGDAAGKANGGGPAGSAGAPRDGAAPRTGRSRPGASDEPHPAGADGPGTPRQQPPGDAPADVRQWPRLPAPEALEAALRTGMPRLTSRRSWPSVPALEHPRALAQAFSGFRGRVPSPHSTVLDEEATAVDSVADDFWLPRLRPERERWLDVVVAVDHSSTMQVWEPTAAALVRLLQRHRAFRDVRVFTLDGGGTANARNAEEAAGRTAGDSPGQGPVPSTARGAVPAPDLRSASGHRVPPRTLVDPTGRRMFLILTDGLGARWQDGSGLRLAAEWGRAGPTAVIHLMPPSLWRRTHLLPERARLRAPRRGSPNSGLRVALGSPGARRGAGHGATPIPVLGLHSRWLTRWAELVSATRTGWVDATVVFPEPEPERESDRQTERQSEREPERDSERQLEREPGALPGTRPAPDRGPGPAADAVPGSPGRHGSRAGTEPSGQSRLPRTSEHAGLSALERVLEFRAAASPDAFRLATMLAAAPLNLPVMRLVQAVMLPGSTTALLAEVFCSGLLRRAEGAAETTGSGDARDTPGIPNARVTYEFRPGVRSALLGCARRADTARVFSSVAQFLQEHVAAFRGVREALVVPDLAADPSVTPAEAPFIRVQQQVYAALSGPYRARAKRLESALSEALPASDTKTEPTQRGFADTKGYDMVDRAGLSTPATAVPPQDPSGRTSATAQPSPGHATETSAGGTPAMPPLRSMGAMPMAEPRAQHEPPPVWGSVPPRNAHFTGREDLLEGLHARLTEGTTAVLPQALHGMGGVGKSQIAVEYVYRNTAEYDVIWWIPSEQPAQIRQALVELAQRLQLPVGTEANTAIPAVREALRLGRPHGKWLLIFDNAESPEAVRPFFPTDGPGRILVTSRNPQWASIARPLEVDVFRREESKLLLRRRGPELSDADADSLAAALGDLPLAIEQAASWRAETGMPASEYLRLFDEKRLELLASSPPMDYEVPVAVAWNVSLDRLRERDPAALQLLQVCSFFAPEPISRSLLSSARGQSVAPDLDEALRDPIRLSAAIREINRYALARINHRTNTIQLHRLVQRVLIGQMTPQERAQMRHGAHVLLAAGDPNDPSSTNDSVRARYAELLPHVSVSRAIECDDPWVRALTLNLAHFLYYWGDHEGSRDLSQEMYDLWRTRLGDDNTQTLAAANRLGFMLRTLGQYQQSSELNEKTLDTYRRAVGQDHEDTLNATGAVAADLRVTGEFQAARVLDEQILERCRRNFGEDDPATLRAAHNLGVSLRLAGDFRAALELDQDTWERRRIVFGEDTESSLNTLNGLTLDQREAGDYLGARVRQESVVAQYRRLFGDENPTTIRALRNLAVARRKAGDLVGAREVSETTWAQFSRRYGEDYPATIGIAINLASDLRQVRDLDGAFELGSQAQQLYRRTLGDDHPHTLSAGTNLAITMRLRGDVEGARDLNTASLAGLERALGPEHVLTLICRTNLASDMYATGEFQRAYEMDVATTEVSRAVLGDDHPSTLALILNMSLDLRRLGEPAKADEMHAGVLERFRQVLGDGHPATVAASNHVRADCDIDPMPL